MLGTNKEFYRGELKSQCPNCNKYMLGSDLEDTCCCGMWDYENAGLLREEQRNDFTFKKQYRDR